MGVDAGRAHLLYRYALLSRLPCHSTPPLDPASRADPSTPFPLSHARAGNDDFNRSIRLKARRHGYRLNQHGLYKDVSRDRKGEKLTEGTLVPGIRTERDIFRVLKVPWSEPEMRIP